MSNIFFASDHHFGHIKMYTEFKNEDGSPCRPFASADEADEVMIDRHNSVVGDQDRVYFLGDVCFHRKFLVKVARMKGRKVLIKGNHDNLELHDYMNYFDDVRGVHQFKGLVMTHIPIHEQSLGRWGFNVHGHLHNHRVMRRKFTSEDGMRFSAEVENDPRYFSVCMEQTNFTPISLEEIKKQKDALDL